jgi:hypothetical protein
MLKLTQQQTRDEIRSLESYISKHHEFDLVEVPKGTISRIIYFAKRSLNNYRPGNYTGPVPPNSSNPNEGEYTPLD